MMREHGCGPAVMHEWLFLLPVPPPSLKDAVEDLEWAGRSRKPCREAAHEYCDQEEQRK